jgi:hypothetical protein
MLVMTTITLKHNMERYKMFKTSAIAAATLALSVMALSLDASAANVGTKSNQGSRDGQTTSHNRFDPSMYSESLIINKKPPRRISRHFHVKSDIEISCKEGKLIVARQGFEDVHTLKCEGRNFTYVAMLDGELLRVNVNRRGDIVGATRF